MDKLYFETNRNSNIQVTLMRLVPKSDHLIMPRVTKFMGLGKLRLNVKKVAKPYSVKLKQ